MKMKEIKKKLEHIESDIWNIGCIENISKEQFDKILEIRKLLLGLIESM